MSVLQDEFFAIGGWVAADEVLEHRTVRELLVIVAASSERILGRHRFVSFTSPALFRLAIVVELR